MNDRINTILLLILIIIIGIVGGWYAINAKCDDEKENDPTCFERNECFQERDRTYNWIV